MTIQHENQSDPFIWAVGIEDTFVPQTRPGYRALDEYELMGHYEHWRVDLALVRDAGVQALRWGVPWYRVEPQPGQFDWRWTDQVVPYMVEELGITPIIDLMHYGCPLWMQQPFLDPSYPQAVARYAAAFAERYRQLVQWYTPLNEPLVNAMMCGRRGVWPPYARGDRGYVRVLLQLVRGMQATAAALTAIDPQVRLVWVDAAGSVQADLPELAGIASEQQHKLFLSYDLLTGTVTPDHGLWAWLISNGASAHELAAIAQQAVALDVLGINFYPQWSTHQLYLNRQGLLASRSTDKLGTGFAAMLQQYWERYRVPLMITETSAYGTHQQRAQWLQSSLAAVQQLRASGVPIIGYTWFPLFTMIDWRYRTGRAPLDQYRFELGLYTLNDGPSPRWRATPLVEPFRDAVQRTAQTVGGLTMH